MYVQRNTEALSLNRLCRGKAISIRYSECVFVALVIQHAKSMRLLYCHLWPVRLHNRFCHYLLNGTIFLKKMSLNIKRVFRVSLQFSSEKNSHSKKNSAKFYHKCTFTFT